MSVGYPNPDMTIFPAQTGRLNSALGGVSIGMFRLPTDPLFYATLTLQNIVAGSRYRITRHDTGAQLATGVAASSTEVITGVPCFANPMQVDITVRNASGGTKYKPFDTAAFMVSAGASAYILQSVDPIA